MATEKKQTIGEMGLDTRLLYQRMLEMNFNDVLTYEQLSSVIGGRDVRRAALSSYHSARRACLREGVVIECVPKVGIRRLDDSGIVKNSSGTLRKIHRAARRGARKLACVNDYANLPRELQTQHNLNMSVLGVLSHATSGRQIKKLETKIAESGASLPLATTLREFGA